MGKSEKKPKKVDDSKKTEVTVEKKAEIKAALRALQAERNGAIAEHDKKKIKAIRAKMKRANVSLKSVKVKPAEPKAEAAS